MATIQLKRGLKANLPAEGQAGEPILTLDEGSLYFGQGPGLPLKKVGDVASILANKAALPATGVEGKLYVVLADESVSGSPSTIYLYNSGAYKVLSGGAVTSTAITTALGYTPEDASKKGANNGYAGLDATGKVPVSQLPDSIKEIRVVATIAARDAIASPFAGLRVHVIDATADTSVTTGWAEYLYTGSAWTKVAEKESIDVVLDWANIQNKPTSTVANIDDAVAKKHTHANQAILDATTEAFTTELKNAITSTSSIDGGTF